MSAVAQEKTPPAVPGPREVKIVSHSMLFYWWPVWAIGLLMAFLTYLDGHLLAIVPKGTEAKEGLQVSGDPRDALVLPPNEHVTQPTLHVASHSGYGVVAGVVLLLVIFITNVPIRGMTSVVAVITLFLMSIILALTGGWDYIFEFLDHSHIFVNAFGYLAIAVPLLVLWLLAVLIFDRQTYMVFTPGQLRVHQNIGGGEVAYDTLGMVVEKRRSDLFRHWILGIGSGDLIVKTGGAIPQQFQMPNVLFVGSKIQMIQQMVQQREIVSGS
ncbi:MAG TPA: hypothetical protein VKA46_24840 [Gemmataceae bacterium]|nr:hypothetical protein [Gemmataceae bacterium]